VWQKGSALAPLLKLKTQSPPLGKEAVVSGFYARIALRKRENNLTT
jgi:hypothetical protein